MPYDDDRLHANEEERDHIARLRNLTHAAAAAAWMASNPGTMRLLERFALDARAAGVDRMGIAFLIERLRWYGLVEKRDAEGYKVNNNHRAYIARELMRRQPPLRDFFTLRTTSDDARGVHLLP